MKILLDENIDVRFKSLFPTDIHEVYTVRDCQWNGIKNGALLKLLKNHSFDCWIVVDKNVPYQQNITELSCLLIVLDVHRNTLKHISPLLPRILSAIQNPSPEKLIVISE